MMPVIGHIQIASVPERHEPMSGELDDRRFSPRSTDWVIRATWAANTAPRPARLPASNG